MARSELRKSAQRLKPVLSIGKSGVTDANLALIDRELEQKELIKIRILKAAEDKEAVTKQILSESRAELIQAIGQVIVIYRRSV